MLNLLVPLPVQEEVAKRAPPVLVERKDDPRLRRIAANRGVDRSEALERRRDIHRAEVVSDDEEDEKDEDEAEQRQRQALLRRAMAESSDEEEEEDEDMIELKRMQAKRRFVGCMLCRVLRGQHSYVYYYVCEHPMDDAHYVDLWYTPSCVSTFEAR